MADQSITFAGPLRHTFNTKYWIPKQGELHVVFFLIIFLMRHRDLDSYVFVSLSRELFWFSLCTVLSL